MATEERDVVTSGFAIVLPAGGDRVYSAEDAVDDIRPSDLLDGRIDPVPSRFANGLRDLSRVDEHLRRNAPDIQTGAAERGMLLEQSNLQIAESLVGNGVAGARADDGEIEMPVFAHRAVPVSLWSLPDSRSMWALR